MFIIFIIFALATRCSLSFSCTFVDIPFVFQKKKKKNTKFIERDNEINP